jgi:hypothetical protein
MFLSNVIAFLCVYLYVCLNVYVYLYVYFYVCLNVYVYVYVYFYVCARLWFDVHEVKDHSAFVVGTRLPVIKIQN